MQKTIMLIIAASFITCKANSQVTKGNWLIGGDGSFTAYTTSNGAGTYSKYATGEIAPSIGYFFFHKLSAGLNTDFTFSHQRFYGNSAYSLDYNYLVFGPYVRYYFLNQKKLLNLFCEANYAYGITNRNDNNQKFSFVAGPEVFFTSSVGLEFTAGYFFYPKDQNIGSNNGFQIGIGIKAHLEKDK